MTTNKYKQELLQALNFLDDQVEEMGSYGEEKEQQIKSVALLREFIENRL